MDRRCRRTREAIFTAFTALLAKKKYSQITVGEIIECADVGRSTFYAHFETKDYLLKALCEELFCHIFDGIDESKTDHKHIFACDPPQSVFLHLLLHLQKDDNRILTLLKGQNNELIYRYFRKGLDELVINQLPRFAKRKSEKLPPDFWVDHITSTFVNTVRWWIENGMKESPETIAEYFYLAV